MASKKQQMAASKSFTPNIIVSRSAQAIEGLFFEPNVTGENKSLRRAKRFDFQLSDSKLQEDIILSPFNNNELISFEASFPGGGGVNFTTIKLIETQRVLERFIIPTDGISDRVAAEFRRNNPDLKKIDSEVLASMKNLRPRYYISFGVGDDLSEWAGPFCVDLIDANLSITADGVRQIELGFTPTIETLKIFTNKIIINSINNKKRNISDASNPKLLLRTTESFSLYSGLIGLDIKKALGPDGEIKQRLGELNTKGDRWNYAIRRLIKKFLNESFESLPDGNVLVLFPQDLDVPASDKNAPINVKAQSRFRDIVSIYRSILRKYGITIFPPDEKVVDNQSLLSRDLKKEEVYQNVTLKFAISQTESNIKNILDKVTPRGGAVGTLTTANENNLEPAQKKELARLRLQRDRQRGEQASIKRFKKEVKRGKEVERNEIATAIRKFGPQGSVFKVAPKSNSDLNNEINKKSEPIFKVGLGFIEDELDTDNLDQVEKAILLKPLSTFFNELNEKVGIEWTIFQENNLQTTKKLKDAGLIENGAAPVVIVGDLGLITNLIYENSEGLYPDLKSSFSYSDDPDLEKTRWESYVKKIQEEGKDKREARNRGRNTSRGLTSSFNEEVDFGVYGNDFALKSGKNDLVFMHNLKNSNVLEVNVDSSPYKGELLDIANEPVYTLIDAAVEGNQEILDASLEFEFIDYIKQYFSTNNIDITKKTPEQLLTLLGNDENFIFKLLRNPQEKNFKIVDFLDILYFKIKTEGGSNISTQVQPGQKFRKDADIVRRVNNFVFKVDIRTLPFFNTNYYINRKCLLVGAPNKISGSNLFKNSRGASVPPPAIFSNNYSIFGYRHVITANEAYSEFTLYQDGMVPSNGGDMTFGEYFKERIESSEPKFLEIKEATRKLREAAANIKEYGSWFGGIVNGWNYFFGGK